MRSLIIRDSCQSSLTSGCRNFISLCYRDVTYPPSERLCSIEKWTVHYKIVWAEVSFDKEATRKKAASSGDDL
jgi:hypothetical protein